ncbi:MAG: roadblock/LC7 domain-containing protein [Thermoplasmata archaeon]
MMAIASVRAVLEDLKSRVDGIATALVSRDGRVLSADLPGGLYAETFAVMCATMFGAAAAGNAELHRAPPQRIVIEGEDSKAIIARTDGNALLVLVVDRSVDLPLVLDQIMKLTAVVMAE